jgi:hypothetical protein
MSGYLALGRAGSTGLVRDFGAYGAAAPGGNSSRLLQGAGSTLQALDSGQDGIGEIKAGLMKLRDTLQAARAQANAVAGRTELKPVFANIEQTVDKPTFLTIDGETVQSGTITTWPGTRPVLVGYEWANRAPLDVGDSLRSLAADVSALVSATGTGGIDGFAADVSALLKSSDFTTAINTPDVAAIDAATARIDDVLAKTDGLKSSLETRALAAAQVDLGGLLLGAAQSFAGNTAALAADRVDSPYAAYSSGSTGTTISSWA